MLRGAKLMHIPDTQGLSVLWVSEPTSNMVQPAT